MGKCHIFSELKLERWCEVKTTGWQWRRHGTRFTPISAQSPYTGSVDVEHVRWQNASTVWWATYKSVLQRLQDQENLYVVWPITRLFTTLEHLYVVWPVTGWLPSLANIQAWTRLWADGKLKLQYCSPWWFVHLRRGSTALQHNPCGDSTWSGIYETSIEGCSMSCTIRMWISSTVAF